MTFNRIIEMTIEPPFKYFIMPTGYLTIKEEWHCSSLKEAKEKGEKFFLAKGLRCSIYNVFYKDGNWETRAGWLSKRLLTLDFDCVWFRDTTPFLIHTSFLVNYDVWKWNPELYDKIRKGFIDDELKDEDSWETVKIFLGKVDFESRVKNACNEVEKKMQEFLKANENLSNIVKQKYPKINAEYGIFDRMIMFYEEDEFGFAKKEFQSLDEVERYYNKKNLELGSNYAKRKN